MNPREFESAPSRVGNADPTRRKAAVPRLLPNTLRGAMRAHGSVPIRCGGLSQYAPSHHHSRPLGVYTQWLMPGPV